MNFYITGNKRGLGYALTQKFTTVTSLEDCDIFINCKHNGFEQVEMLYKAADLKKRIINISSNSGDGIKQYVHKYAIEKIALDKANEQLFYLGVNTTSLRLGYFDSPRVEHVNEPKMTIDYVMSVIEWIIDQPYRIKEITIIPGNINCV